MKVLAVGSTNAVKVGAVEAVTAGLPALKGVSVVGVSVASGVSEQPLSLDEIYTGAASRAQAALRAHAGASWAVGIEDGLYPAPGAAEGHLNVCVASVIDPDGRQNFGASSSFMVPAPIARHILDEGLDLSQALRAEGLTGHADIGRDVGAVGLLSRGRLVRQDYTKQAVLAALIPWM